MSIEVHPTGAAVGAEIHGVDLSRPMDDSLFADIEDAFDRHGVVFFRGQKLAPEDQVAFTRRFGEIEHNHNARDFGIDGSPEIYVLSNIRDGGRPIGVKGAGARWHTDMCYAPRPARATMLHALEVPELHGLALGDTEFANAADAWDALPPAMRRRLEGVRAVFDFAGRRRGRPVPPETIARYPPVTHPVARTHPRTGRKGLYVMRDDCTGIVGMEEEEGLALIAALADHVVRPEFLYRHRWRAGDLLVWDNCTVQHRAIMDFDLPQRRLMWRTTVRGSTPF